MPVTSLAKPRSTGTIVTDIRLLLHLVVLPTGLANAWAVADWRQTGHLCQNCTPRVSAPSTTRLVPVMKLAAGLARNTTARAISSGRPIRPAGFNDRASLNR